MLPSVLEKKHGPTIFLLTSDFAFLVTHAMAQRLEHRGMSTSQIVFFRFLLSSIVSAVILFVRGAASLRDVIDVHQRSTRLIWIRGAIHTVAISAFYVGIKYLPISDALTLFHLKPFPVAIMCALVLKEVISRVQLSATVISFAAVVLVTQPTAIFGSLSQHQSSSTTELAVGYIAILGASVLIGVDLVLLKLIGMVDPYFIMLVYSISASAFSAVSVTTSHEAVVKPDISYIVVISPAMTWQYTALDWCTLLALSTLGLVAHVIETFAIQRTSGMHVALLGYSQIPFAAVVQFIFTFTLPSPLTVLGSGIIVAAGVWSILKGTATREDHKDDREGYELVLQDESARGSPGASAVGA